MPIWAVPTTYLMVCKISSCWVLTLHIRLLSWGTDGSLPVHASLNCFYTQDLISKLLLFNGRILDLTSSTFKIWNSKSPHSDHKLLTFHLLLLYFYSPQHWTSNKLWHNFAFLCTCSWPHFFSLYLIHRPWTVTLTSLLLGSHPTALCTEPSQCWLSWLPHMSSRVLPKEKQSLRRLEPLQRYILQF